jgi:hypothetical protein
LVWFFEKKNQFKKVWLGFFSLTRFFLNFFYFNLVRFDFEKLTKHISKV